MSEQLSDETLLQYARTAREQAFAPYSEYPVGAAVDCDGEVYHGANIEVSGRSTSVHAEMMAIFNAVLDGQSEYRTLAVSPAGQTGVAICSLCQHTVAQFTDDLRIIEDTGDDYEEYWLDDLLGPAYRPIDSAPKYCY